MTLTQMADEPQVARDLRHGCPYNLNVDSPFETSEVDDSSIPSDVRPYGNHKRHRRGKKRKSLPSGTMESLQPEASPSIVTDNIETLPPCRRRNRRKHKLVIRPTIVPKAPENSTQFIIDNHETSSLFQSFEKGNSPLWTDMYGPEDLCNYSNSVMSSSQSDLLWDSYSQRNFEEMYRSAREDELAELSNEVLVEKIEVLECKVKELEEKLHMRDPETLILKLQHELLRLQEDHRLMDQIHTKLLSRKNCVSV